MVWFTDLIHSFGDEDLSKNYGEAIERLEKLKIKTKEIELPNLELSLPVYYVIAPAECSANLSRYDGIRFGYRAENVENLEDLYFKSRGEGFERNKKKDTYRNLLLIFRILRRLLQKGTKD